MKSYIVVVAILIFLVRPNLLLGQEKFKELTSGQIIGHSFKTWPKDFVGIAKEPFAHKKTSLIIIGSTIALMAVDKPTQRFVQNTINPLFDWDVAPIPGISDIKIGTRSIFGGATNGYLMIGLSAQYLGSLAFKAKRGQISALLAGKAIATSYVVSHLVLKSVFARKRPYDPLDGPYPADGLPKGFTTDNWDFGNYEWPSLSASREGASFPSFHFTMYFAVSRVFYKTYNKAWWAYGIAVLGLLPDFDLHNHWVSDMFMGAVVGTVIGDVIYRNFRRSVVDDNKLSIRERVGLRKVLRSLTVSPSLSPSYSGLSVRLAL